MAYDKVVDSAKLDAALTETANAIKEKIGSIEPIAFDRDTGFKSAVESIESGGGYDEGYEQGYQDGNCINPNWTNFAYFCYARPDLVPRLKYSDTANSTEFLYMFASIGSNIAQNVIVPSIDTRKGKNFTNMFIYSSGIVEIGLLDLSNATSVQNMFSACRALERISFAKECIKLSISFSNSDKLDNASKQSIFDGLATVGTAQTLTLHTNLKILQSQVDDANAKGWTVAGGIVVSEEEYNA